MKGDSGFRVLTSEVYMAGIVSSSAYFGCRSGRGGFNENPAGRDCPAHGFATPGGLLLGEGRGRSPVGVVAGDVVVAERVDHSAVPRLDAGAKIPQNRDIGNANDSARTLGPDPGALAE